MWVEIKATIIITWLDASCDDDGQDGWSVVFDELLGNAFYYIDLYLLCMSNYLLGSELRWRVKYVYSIAIYTWIFRFTHWTWFLCDKAGLRSPPQRVGSRAGINGHCHHVFFLRVLCIECCEFIVQTATAV